MSMQSSCFNVSTRRCVILLALCFAGNAVAQNVLFNPGFDSTVDIGGKLVPAIWRMSTGDTFMYDFSCDTVDRQAGAGSLRVRVKVDGTTSCCHIDQRLADTLVGHSFHVSAWIKASTAIVNNAQLVLQVGDTRNGGWRQVQWLMLSGFNVTEWTHIEKTATLSPDGNRVMFTVYVKPNQPAGTTVWVDEVVMTDVNTGVVYRLPPMNAITIGTHKPLTVYRPDGRRMPGLDITGNGLSAPGLYLNRFGRTCITR